MIRDVDIKHVIVSTPYLGEDGKMVSPVIGVTLTWVRTDGSSYDQTVSVDDDNAPHLRPKGTE